MPKPSGNKKRYVLGKGDWTRPVVRKTYEENYEEIFGKKPLPNEQKEDFSLFDAGDEQK